MSGVRHVWRIPLIERCSGACTKFIFSLIFSPAMTTNFCPSCCANCFVDEIPSDSSKESILSLENFLPVGCVFVNLSIQKQQQICAHVHAQDGWHYFQGQTIIPHLSNSEDISLCRQIETLMRRQIITATYRAADNEALSLTLRIYLIPSDSVEKAHLDCYYQRKYLRELLLRVIKNQESWSASGLGPAEDSEKISLLPLCKVLGFFSCPITKSKLH
jgi:hypothetical protein